MTDKWRLIDGTTLFDIQSDPGQKKDVASGNPDVVKRLRGTYEEWWKDVSARHSEYCRTVLGTEHENPVTLTAHDWHHVGRINPWNHGHIRRDAFTNGQWAVEVSKPGKYEISLRRWPVEVDAAINAAIEGGKALSPAATKARIQIGKIDESKPVAADAKAVTFTVNLPAGSAMLKSWITDAKGTDRGAYFAYVKRLK